MVRSCETWDEIEIFIFVRFDFQGQIRWDPSTNYVLSNQRTFNYRPNDAKTRDFKTLNHDQGS
jgi:hypothetical protein